MKRTTLAVLAVSAVTLSGISTANANTFNNTTGLPGVGITPAGTITFDGAGFAANSVVTNQFAFQGVTFSPNLYYDGNGGGSGCNFNDESGDCLTTFFGPGSGNVAPFSIFFTSMQTSAAFAMVTGVGTPATTTFTALKNGVVVDQTSFTTGVSGNQPPTVPNFFGFYQEAGGFNQILVSINSDFPGNVAIIDNIQLSVPEPGTIGLLLVGVSGLFVTARRRRKA